MDGNAGQTERQKTEIWNLQVDGTSISLAITHRKGPLAPVLFLHGFGSTKEDYFDFLLKEHFANHAFIAYDAPGCGQSTCADPTRLSIPFLVKTAEAVTYSIPSALRDFIWSGTQWVL